MARFEKSRPKSAKPNAAVAPARPRGLDRALDRGHDVLPAAAAPREVDVRVARPRVRPRLRRLRRRCRGRRHRRRLPRLRRRRAQSVVRRARARPRRTPKDPQAWRDLATALQTEGETARSDRRARHAPSSSRRRTTSAYRELAGLHLTRATERQRGRAARRRHPRGVPRAVAGLPVADRPSGAAACHDPIATAVSGAAIGTSNRGAAGGADARRASPSTRTSGSWRSSRTTRTCSSSSRRPRSRPVTRRPRSPPTSGSWSSRPTTRARASSRAAEAAPRRRRRVGLDSLPRGAAPTARRRDAGGTPSSCSPSPLARASGSPPAATPSATEGSGDRIHGKELFVEGCGSCHTLADAGTTGTIGPDLDYAFVQSRIDGLGEDTIQQVVRGQIAYPVDDAPTGAPGMPADISRVRTPRTSRPTSRRWRGSTRAGKPIDPANPPEADAAGRRRPTARRSSPPPGCAGCHTLAAAGSSGTVGPNLDDAKPVKELAIDRVTNGQGGMPSFKGQLSEEQIQAVAHVRRRDAGKTASAARGYVVRRGRRRRA